MIVSLIDLHQRVRQFTAVEPKGQFQKLLNPEQSRATKGKRTDAADDRSRTIIAPRNIIGDDADLQRPRSWVIGIESIGVDDHDIPPVTRTCRNGLATGTGGATGGGPNAGPGRAFGT